MTKTGYQEKATDYACTYLDRLLRMECDISRRLGQEATNTEKQPGNRKK